MGSPEYLKEYDRQMASQDWLTYEKFLDRAFGVYKVSLDRLNWFKSS